jgi:hypothetical protein
MIFTAKQTDQFFLFQNVNYTWYSDYNAKLINDAYFKPNYPLRVYLVQHPDKKKRWQYFLIDFRHSPNVGEVFYTSDNATEMLEFILENVVYFKFGSTKTRNTLYNNFCKKYNVKAVCSLLVSFLCLSMGAILFKTDSGDNSLADFGKCILLGGAVSWVGIAFSKIMYDEK